MYACMYGRIYGWMGGRVDGWVGETLGGWRVGEWMNGWVDE